MFLTYAGQYEIISDANRISSVITELQLLVTIKR